MAGANAGMLRVSGALCAIAVCGALELKLTSAIAKTRCLEALKILELTEILVCMVIVPAVLNANLTARIAAQAIKLWLWELWRASCDRGEMLVNFNICYPAIGGLPNLNRSADS